jgi:hypothetical protein
MNHSGLRARQPERDPWTRDKLIRMCALALGHAHASSTHSTYSSALHSYISFCQNHGFYIEPSADTLSFYIVYMSFHIQPSSVESYLSGIQSELKTHFPHIRLLRRSHLVTQTLRGCKRLRNTEIRRKRPFQPEDLQLLLSHYAHSSSHDDFLFISQVTSGFNALNRLGELVWPDNTTQQSYRNMPLRHSVRWYPHAFSYLLPSHKADPFFEGNRLLIQQTDPPLDTFTPFIRYIQSCNQLFPGHPALWLKADGTVPTRRWFMSQLRLLFPTEVAGQSLRSGGATALALAGVPNDRIQAAGRWSSDTFQAYIRKNPILLQSLIWGRPTLSTAYPSSHRCPSPEP